MEKELSKLSFEDRYKIRLERLQPILEAFFLWLKTPKPRVLPKSAFGQAIHYCLNQWEKLTTFMKDGLSH
ncbi:transposase [Clostridium sp. ZS2-4]|nr:transposase [Clostridium sp. ZS2-4]MCY6355332.1 transposase [Clostridium sp. ZS2-4]